MVNILRMIVTNYRMHMVIRMISAEWEAALPKREYILQEKVTTLQVTKIDRETQINSTTANQSTTNLNRQSRYPRRFSDLLQTNRMIKISIEEVARRTIRIILHELLANMSQIEKMTDSSQAAAQTKLDVILMPRSVLMIQDRVLEVFLSLSQKNMTK